MKRSAKAHWTGDLIPVMASYQQTVMFWIKHNIRLTLVSEMVSAQTPRSCWQALAGVAISLNVTYGAL